MQNNEETFAKYAVYANLFRLGSTNPKKNIQALDVFFFLGGAGQSRRSVYRKKNVSFGQIKLGQVSQLMLGSVRLDQVSLVYFRLGQIRLGQTNIPLDECSVRRMFRKKNVPLNQCSIRRMFRQTNVPLNQCSIRPMFLRRKCFRRK